MAHGRVVPDVGELVRGAQAGDTAARDELIALHLPLIYNIVGRALAGGADVDDLVQETMLRALHGLPALREPDRFRSWLVAIAYRQIHLHLRAGRRTRHRLLPEPVEVAEDDFADRATAELVIDEQRRELVEASRWLDPDDRRLLGLWWQESAGELTRAELAAALNVRPKHASVRVRRMKDQLEASRAVVRALHARPRCARLTTLTRRWDGVADPLWRKRLARHVRDCPGCAPKQHGMIKPEELLLGLAALPVPAGLAVALPLKTALLTGKSLGAVAAAAAVAVGGGFVFAVRHSPAPAEIAAPPPPAVATTAAAPTPARSPAVLPAAGLGVQRADIFVAPGGSDSGDGSLARPYRSLRKAVESVRPGETIALRGGTYRPDAGLEITVDGRADRRITLSAYRDERPVIDARDVPANEWAVTQRASYWTVQGLTVRGARSHAYVCSGCREVTFRHLTMHGNVRSGLMLRDPGTTGNRVLDSDFHDNTGTGLSVQFGAGEGNLLRGNRAYRNGLAGYDLGAFESPVTVEYNWSFRNGGNGFVLNGGPGAAHSLRHDAAWSNGGHGFTDDGGSSAPLTLTNNTAYDNGRSGFALPNDAATFRLNASTANNDPDSLGAAKQTRHGPAEFRSTDAAEAEGPRPSTARLPGTAFLTTDNGIGASMTGR